MEEDIKLRVCRLCFNLISDKNFLLIKDSLQDMLRVITTEVDLEKTSNPAMCNDCSRSLQEIFIFKTNFFESEEKIEAKTSSLNNVKLDLSDVMNKFCKRSQKLKTVNVQKTKVCRTCLRIINKKKFIDLNIIVNSRLSSILRSCVPEMMAKCSNEQRENEPQDLSLTKNPIICQICYDALQKMEYFKSFCNINESKIDTFSRTMGFDPLVKINLYEVLHFSKSNLPLSNAPIKFNNNADGDVTHQKHLAFNAPTVTIKMEPNIGKTEKYLKIDCLEYVAVKMESYDEDQVTGTKICLKKKNLPNRLHSSRRETQKRPKKTNDKGEDKSIICCSDCTFKTKYRHNLRRHLIISHKRKDIVVNKKFYQCAHCSFSAKWNIDLTRHSLSHVKPDALKCTKCPYSTEQNSHLINHILSHVNADNKGKVSQLTKQSN